MASTHPTPFWSRRRTGCTILALLTLAFFGDLLFAGGDSVISGRGEDVWNQFAGWRHFGFTELRRGNFPLWVPQVCAGMPYFTGFQSALLYPPNWIHLVLPLVAALNWGVALHAWWLGAGTLLWLRQRGMSAVAALFGGALVIFCAPHVLHVAAGHLTNLCVMAWVPWLLLALERWREKRRLCWIVAGAAIVALQIFAGHPQYVYFGGMVTGIYALARAYGAKRPGGFLGGLALIYLLGAGLAAVQLLPGLAAAPETLRSMSDINAKEFASAYSFPPENLLTLVAPHLLEEGETRFTGAAGPSAR